MIALDEDFASLIPDEPLAQFLRDAGSLDLAWRSCPRADWLVQLATSAGHPRESLVALACDLIEDVARHAGGSLGDGAGPDAWRLAKQWSRGASTARECWASGFRASRTESPTHLERACASVAFACDAEAALGYYAERGHAAESVRHATRAATDTSGLATWIRQRLAVHDVRAGLMRRSVRGSIPPGNAPVLPAHDSERPRAISPSTLESLRRV